MMGRTARFGRIAGVAMLVAAVASTVAEAPELLDDVQPVKVRVKGHESNVHLAIGDADGDSAII